MSLICSLKLIGYDLAFTTAHNVSWLPTGRASPVRELYGLPRRIPDTVLCHTTFLNSLMSFNFTKDVLLIVLDAHTYNLYFLGRSDSTLCVMYSGSRMRSVIIR